MLISRTKRSMEPCWKHPNSMNPNSLDTVNVGNPNISHSFFYHHFYGLYKDYKASPVMIGLWQTFSQLNGCLGSPSIASATKSSLSRSASFMSWLSWRSKVAGTKKGGSFKIGYGWICYNVMYIFTHCIATISRALTHFHWDIDNIQEHK
jgi:hypothetical protein